MATSIINAIRADVRIYDADRNTLSGGIHVDRGTTTDQIAEAQRQLGEVLTALTSNDQNSVTGAAARYAEARQAFERAVTAHKEAHTQLGVLQTAMHDAGEHYRAAEAELLEAAASTQPTAN